MTSDQESAADVLADLRARLVAKECDLATIQAERKKLSLDAAQGDRGAIARRATLLSQSKAATELIEELHGAIDEAKKRANDEAKAITARVAADTRALAQRLAVKFMRQGERIDQALLSISSAMAEREEIARALAATGVLPPTVMDRLGDWQTFHAAVHAAGVHPFLNDFVVWSAKGCEPIAREDYRLLHDLLRDQQASSEPQPEPQAA
jgi:hypothetical protein